MRDQALAVCSLPSQRQLVKYGATSMTTLLQMVSHGMGLTLIPEIAVRAEARSNHMRIVPFDGEQPKREIALFWRRQSMRRKDFQALGDCIVESGQLGFSFVQRNWQHSQNKRGGLKPPYHEYHETGLHAAGIVRAFAGDCNAMRMAFPQPGVGNAHKSRFLAEFLQRLRAYIAHGSAQTACKLVQDRGNRPLVSHLSFDAFRYELQLIAHFRLEITISRAARHGTDRTHTAIGFERAAPDANRLRRGFLPYRPTANQPLPRLLQRPTLWRNRRKLDAAISDYRDILLLRCFNG
jgi:hypothetical protein